tara:strand:- start:79 stop:357 length:279 start_codon:yes stop_codon:yes gene_type:complete
MLGLSGPEKVSMLLKVQTHASWNLIKRCNIVNGCDVEALKSIRMQVVAHEHGKVIQAFLQIVHRVAGCLHNFWIIPNLRVQVFHACGLLLEE